MEYEPEDLVGSETMMNKKGAETPDDLSELTTTATARRLSNTSNIPARRLSNTTPISSNKISPIQTNNWNSQRIISPVLLSEEDDLASDIPSYIPSTNTYKFKAYLAVCQKLDVFAADLQLTAIETEHWKDLFSLHRIPLPITMHFFSFFS